LKINTVGQPAHRVFEGNRMMDQHQIKYLIQQGMEELNRTLYEGKSDRLINYLRVMAKMPHYSFRNCLLIEQQLRQRDLPPATLVFGFQSWKKLGRHVKKGEKGLGIVAPLVRRKPESDNILKEAYDLRFAFRVAHVFDVSQTEGKELPSIAIPTGDPHPCLARLEQLIVENGSTVSYQPMRDGVYGSTFGKKIVVSESLDDVERLMTLAHEYAHVLMHSTKDARRKSSKLIRETEAEAVACIVGFALGIDSVQASADYIQLHDGNSKLFTERMNRIQQTATQILRGIRHTNGRDICELRQRGAAMPPDFASAA